MPAEGKRSFWIHQLAEYVIGGAMVASGLQSPTPVVPSVVGGIIIVNAAIVQGPLGAFRLVGRRTHRVLDWVVVVIALGSVLWPGVEIGTRLVQLMIAIVYAVVVWRTDYSVKAPKGQAPPSDGPMSKGEEIGRAAGRFTAKGVQAVKRKTG